MSEYDPQLMSSVLSPPPADEELRAAWLRSLKRLPMTLLGGPVDFANTAIGGLDYLGGHRGNIHASEKPVGGSQWLAELYNQHVDPNFPTEPGSPNADMLMSLLFGPTAAAGARGAGAVKSALLSAEPGPIAGSPGAQIGAVGDIPKRAKRRVGTTGQFVGAPPGIDSPQKHGAIVKTYLDAMEEGFPGRNFYNESSADVWARSGHDIPLADPTVRNLALLSRANNVGGNTTMSTKGHVQAVTGQPVSTGRFPSKDSGPVAEAYAAGENFAGLKREPFAEQLAVAWAPERIGRGVNDMHEAELMGFPPGQTLSPSNHAYMDEVRASAIRLANQRRLGGAGDWNTGTAQAAAWTGNKIRRGEVAPGDAAKNYADYLPRMEANATYESFPGVGTGHLPNAPANDFAAKQAFHDDPAGSWATSPSGRDVGYTAARLLPGEDVPAVGRFNDEVNPATVATPVVSQVTTPQGPRMLESARDALNLVEGKRAYADVQNAGAWHKIYESKADDYTGAKLHVPDMSEAKMKALAPIFEKNGYYIGSSPEGIAIIANDSTAKGKPFAAEIRSY